MKKLFLIFFILMTALSTAAYALTANDDDAPDDSNTKKRIYHIVDGVDMIPTNKLQYEKPRIVIKVMYPLLKSQEPNESVQKFNQLVDQIIREETTLFTEEVKNNQDIQASIKKNDIKNDLVIDFNTAIVSTNKHPIISVRFSIQTYITGMAHPSNHHRVLNYNFDKGQKLTLADLFKSDTDYLTFLSDYTRDALSKRLKDKIMLNDGTAPKEENFKNWNINPHGLMITFDEAQVAPYVYGSQSVIIPYSLLKEMLVPKSVIAACLKHRKRCLQNNLLTGGFIDEAANTPRANSHHRTLDPILRHS